MSLALTVQRVRSQLLVLEQLAQGQGNPTVLVAFRPGRKGLGIQQGVAPKRFEIDRRVKWFNLGNMIGIWHDVPPRIGRERY
jgi:hypothetical protein